MKEINDLYDPTKQSKGALPNVRTRTQRQNLPQYNAAPKYPDKTEGQKSQLKLNRLGKSIAKLISKANSFISGGGLAEKIRVPVSLQKINAFVADYINHASRYFGLPSRIARDNKLQPLIDGNDAGLNSDIIGEEVIQKLQDSMSSPAMGKVMRNHKGDFLGTIKEITYDDDDRSIQYIILNCTNFFGQKDRYFAIPALSTFVGLDEKGQIVMKFDKNELKLAKGIAADKCPRLSLKFGQSIYELYHYDGSEGTRREYENGRKYK